MFVPHLGHGGPSCSGRDQWTVSGMRSPIAGGSAVASLSHRRLEQGPVGDGPMYNTEHVKAIVKRRMTTGHCRFQKRPQGGEPSQDPGQVRAQSDKSASNTVVPHQDEPTVLRTAFRLHQSRLAVKGDPPRLTTGPLHTMIKRTDPPAELEDDEIDSPDETVSEAKPQARPQKRNLKRREIDSTGTPFGGTPGKRWTSFDLRSRSLSSATQPR